MADEPRFCVNCKHYGTHSNPAKAQCGHVTVVHHLVTGEGTEITFPCETHRYGPFDNPIALQFCGPQGAFFEAK